MRHAYVADVGDFGKYGLLRALHRGRPAYQLGVVWYLTDAREENNDGRHNGYLVGSPSLRKSFRDCDEDLYDAMSRMRRESRLSVRDIQCSGVLPEATVYFDLAVPNRDDCQPGRSIQWTARHAWHREAQKALLRADYVFTDPDNGILFPDRASNTPLERSAPSHKHSYWHELAAFLESGKSVIAYHHLGRQRGGHTAQILRCLRIIYDLGHEAEAIHYRRGTARAFVAIPGTNQHKRWLFETCRRFAENWAAHARLAELPCIDS